MTSTTNHRGAPVSVEEMTRRRDGWRVAADTADRELRAALARGKALEKRAEVAEREAHLLTSQLRQMEREVAAAQAEARRYALECGRLRAALAAALEAPPWTP